MTLAWMALLSCNRCSHKLESTDNRGMFCRPPDWAEVTIKGVDYHLCPTCVTVLRDWIKRGKETGS